MAVRASRDRKSTRLNSSHVAISYAVFCLKKKKKMSSLIIGAFLRIGTVTRAELPRGQVELSHVRCNTFDIAALGISSVAIFVFFFNDTATTEIYTLSLHDALPIAQSAICPIGWRPSSSVHAS